MISSAYNKSINKAASQRTAYSRTLLRRYIYETILKIIYIFVIFCCSIELSIASDQYEALFEIDMPEQISNGLLRDYVNATESLNEIIAISNWETYIKKYAYNGPYEVEDLTHLVFVRQAHFELARLYYMHNKSAAADAILKIANEFVVYTSPELSNGKKWCKVEGYCQ